MKTIKFRPCFVAYKKTAQADTASRDGAAIAHLDLPSLTGSERQIAWATTIRTSRLAALISEPDDADASICQAYLPLTDDKW